MKFGRHKNFDSHQLLALGLATVVCSLMVIASPSAAQESAGRLGSTDSKARLNTVKVPRRPDRKSSTMSSATEPARGSADQNVRLQEKAAINTLAGSLKPEKGMADDLTVSIGSEVYLNRTSPPAGIADYHMVSGHLRTHSEGQWVTAFIEAAGSFATTVENYTNFEIPQAYFNWEGERTFSSRNLRTRLSLGRKLEAWNQLDSDWSLGIWQPLTRCDYLRATEQGLTGAFVAFQKGDFEVMVFGSSIFIPEQSPPYDLQNGKFTTNSPWFSEPADSLILFGEKTDVMYRLATPTIGSVINHNSGAILARIGSLDGGYFVQGSLAKKPRNTLSLPFEGKMELTNDTSFANVTVHPTVAYHTLVGLDGGFRSRLFSVGLSILHENVDAEPVEPDLNRQILAPMTMFSPKVEVRTFSSRPWGPRLSLSYLHTNGGEVTEEGPLAAGKGVFGPRTIYRQAIGFGAETMLVRYGRFRLHHGIKWIEELTESGTVLMNQVRMHFGDDWRLAIFADILGSRQPINQTQSFIARYRGNDRIAGQLTYSF